MKSLEEKKLLARMARNIGQPDLVLEESIRHEEALLKNLFKQEPEPIVEEKIQEATPQQDIVTTAVQHIKAPPKQRLTETPDLISIEITRLRRQLADVMNKIGTMSWGGGGTGVVRYTALDDHQYPSDINHISFNTTPIGYDPPDGSISWNPVEECLDVHQPDGTTLQVGLESYIRVYNDTNEEFVQGTVVMFAGVHEPPNTLTEEHAPTIAKYLADAEYPPLYVIGVLTENILPHDYGRATTFGKVRELNTSGSTVGETWVDGDLLWAHPTIPGALTKNQPTAPFLAVSIAAVVHADATNGHILVRPSIFPRLHFGTFSSNTEQTAAQTNTPYAVTFDTTGIGCGHIRINPNNTSNVNVVHQGLYSFDFRLQVSSTNSSRAFIWIWARVNGVDVPRSASKLSIESNGGEATPSWAFRLPMEANSVFQLMWAVDSTNIKLSAPAATAFAPATPAALLQVTQVNL